MKSPVLDLLESSVLPYHFEDDKFKIFNRKKKVFLIIQTVFVVCQMNKLLINGILNSNLVRLYVVEFICTFSKYQALFDFSLAVSFIFLFRCNIYLLLNQNRPKKFEHLYFLTIKRESELLKEHNLTRRSATNYLFLVDLSVKFLKLNRLIYYLGLLFGFGRVLVFAFFKIDFKWFILISLPSTIVSITLNSVLFNVISFYYLVFCLNSFFMTAKLRSFSQRFSSLLINNKSDNKLIFNINRNLVHLSKLIKNFKLSQKDFDFTLCCYNAGMFIVCLSFPYILLFQTDDLFSKCICTSLYIQTIAMIWIIIGANSYIHKKGVLTFLLLFKTFVF